MSKLTIIDNEFASLWYYPDKKIIHHQIKKYITGKPLQDLLNRGTEELRKNGAKKWLSDDRNNNALGVKDTEWANNIWFPNTAQAGWKYWALVQPEKITGQMNMKRQTSFVSDAGVVVKVFNDPDEAMSWLEAQ
ncbi:hypothetical protein DCMF_24310 [Candidatus Formimonas warabiya]|uniref:STAS/SEC14 domain-containing protein n=2 Tax=Formimonas warabiya TaxID=1761012 RepID=A0A3G1KYJ1_FORW1|nr:hypothetical protein DCMF_24310 [Candidatus Formimonas warabiya]